MFKRLGFFRLSNCGFNCCKQSLKCFYTPTPNFTEEIEIILVMMLFLDILFCKDFSDTSNKKSLIQTDETFMYQPSRGGLGG
jgi:hypothetical protein